jgi:Xaa-Pro aminopeptidase
MSNQELDRARAELKKIGADWALLSSGENVTYVSHWEVPVDFGAPAALNYSPPMALIGVTDSASGILVSSSYQGSAKAQSALDDVISYDVSALTSHNAPPPPSATWIRDAFADAFRQTLKLIGLKAKLAIEEKTLPAIALRILSAEFPNLELIEAGPALAAARMIKTERELDLLRAAAEVNCAGHTELLNQCRAAGKNEFDLWSAVVRTMESKVGHTLNVFGEIVTGIDVRVVAYPGGPKNRVTRPGDLALMDMSPRVNGYWSDCTNTMVIGGVKPTAKQKLYGVAAREAFHAAAEMLRPGRKAHEAFDAAKATFDKHGLQIGHYAGHQIGTTVNENPRLVPTDQTVVQAGMVFSIETGSYEGPSGEAGARMEKSVIVHDSGPEIICDFEWGF